jgi:hypothetical protein
MTPPLAFDRSITAIIATYNRSRYIGEAIESILGQIEPPRQLIVVDDGSEDDTASVVARFGSKVEYLRKDNGGKSTAINFALGQARHAWLWLFDDDDVALPDATRTLLDALAADPTAEFAFSGQIVADDDGSGRLQQRRSIVPRIERMDGLLFELLQAYRFQMQSMLVNRAAFVRVGAMDARFLRGQDYELMIRLARHLRGAQVSRPTFIWRQHPGERGPSQLRHGAGDRERLWNRFERMLGEDIRAKLALGEYLVPPRREDLALGEERKVALIHRAAVMATKGLVDAFVEDVRSAAACSADRSLTPQERPIVLGSVFSDRFTSRLAEEPELGSRLRSLSGTGSRLARDVLACCARAALHEARHGQRGRAQRGRLLRDAIGFTSGAGMRATLAALRQ